LRPEYAIENTITKKSKSMKKRFQKRKEKEKQMRF